MENIDWSALGFDYHKTDVNVRYYFTDGKWSDMEVTSDEYIKMHMSASCLHYGIELFEGLKAFRGVDGKVRLFRVEDNARRLRSSAERLCLPLPTVEMVVNACVEVVRRNEAYIPPYGTGASLYLRPVMFGTTAGLGVKPAKDALLIVYCSPVGAYFKEGIKPILVAIDRCRVKRVIKWVIRISCTSMRRSINTSKSAEHAISSALRMANTSLRNPLRCFRRLPI